MDCSFKVVVYNIFYVPVLNVCYITAWGVSMKKKRVDLFLCIASIILSGSMVYAVEMKRLTRLDIIDDNVAQDIDSYSLQDIKILDERLLDMHKDTQAIVQKIVYKKDKQEENIASKILCCVSINKKIISSKSFSGLLRRVSFCETSKVFGSVVQFFSSVPVKEVWFYPSSGEVKSSKIKTDNIDPKVRKIMDIATKVRSEWYKGWDARFYKDETIALVKGNTTLRMFDVINGYCMHTFKPGYSVCCCLLSSDNSTLLVNDSENKFYFFDLTPLQKLRADFKSLSLLQVFVLRKLFKQLGTLKTDEESRSNQILKKIKSKLVTTRLNNEEEKILSSLPQSIKVAVKKMR